MNRLPRTEKAESRPLWKLWGFLGRGDEDQKKDAIDKLGQLRAIEAFPNLLDILVNDNEKLKTAAINALGEIGGKDIFQQFSPHVLNGDFSDKSLDGVVRLMLHVDKEKYMEILPGKLQKVDEIPF